MNFPDELRYSSDHEWVKQEGDMALIGITDFAQKELGDIVYVDISTVGQELKAGDVFGTVEAVKTVSDLFMPVAGKIIEVNKGLDNAPELINQDPYTQGWIVRIEPTGEGEGELMDAASYRSMVGV